MRKCRFILLLIVLSLSAQTSHAQGFVLGMLLGASMSSGDSISGGSNPSVIYEAPLVSLRLKDPLEVKMESSRGIYFLKSVGVDREHVGAGKTLKQLISSVNGELLSGGIEILQVSKVVSPSNPSAAYIWITYTEKSNMLTLEELQRLQKEQKASKKK